MPEPHTRQLRGCRADSRPLEAADFAAYLAPDPELAGAACAAPGIDPELFFPHSGDSVTVKAAKSICFGCPVRAACLQGAIARKEKHGVFGGHHFRPRSRLAPARVEQEVSAA